MMLEIWDYVTAVNGIIMGFLPLLHVMKMFKEKSSKGQSVLAILFAGILCGVIWFVYGLGHNLLVIILTSSTVIIVNTIVLLTVLRFKEKSGDQA